MSRPLTRCARPLAVIAVFLSGLLSFESIRAQRSDPPGEWRYTGGAPYSLRYSPLDQITKDNVKDLEILWKWNTVEVEVQRSGPAFRVSRNENTPLMANGVLYTVTGLGFVVAIDPGTGQTRWVYDPQSYKPGRPNNGGFLSRSFGYWTDGKVERVLTGTHDGYLLSLDARTGKPDPAFGTDGRVDGNVGIRDVQRSTNLSLRGPWIAGNIAILGSSIADGGRDTRHMPPGYVNAFDVRTGKHLWTFHTVPKAGEFGYDSWLNGSAEFNGNTNVWGGMAYDPELDYVYMAVSTPTSDYYGVDRHGDNLFAESLVCVEAKTGKRVWHFQAVHHGLWDYDFPTNPILGDINVNGRRIRAVIQVSKQAFAYVFDRKTGQPVWPIEERPVPQSTVAGERTSPTQPIPSKPPAFDLQGSLEANLIDFTPELRQRGLEQLKTFVAGPLFMPPSEQGTLQLPGNLGGANWGGAAFDPETGILYVPSRTTPTIARATPRAPGAAPGATAAPPASGAERGGQAGRGGAPQAAPAGRGLGASDHDDAQAGRGGTPAQGSTPPAGRGGGPGAGAANPANRMTVDGLPLFKPPYARLTAIDLNKGEHLWTTAVGEGPRNHPLLKDLKLPPLGDAMDGIGVLLTKNVVFVTTWRRQRGTGAALVPSWEPYGDPNALRKVLYAFDKRTGALLREFEMDGYSAAPPMSYMHGGKQYLVMAVGANEEAAMVAFGLPGARRR